jgi:hypothetical protein
MGINVTFIENNQRIGRARHYTDTGRIDDILKAAHCPLEDHHMVAMMLHESRPGRVNLHLTGAVQQTETRRVMAVTVNEKMFGMWNIENVPACDEGLKLAADFMAACLRGVEQVGLEQTLTLRGDFHFQYSRFAAHYEGCDKCGEAWGITER